MPAADGGLPVDSAEDQGKRLPIGYTREQYQQILVDKLRLLEETKTSLMLDKLVSGSPTPSQVNWCDVTRVVEHMKSRVISGEF